MVPLLPLVPVQVPVEHFHVLAAADHEGVGAIDVVGAIDMVADSLRRMLAGEEVLATEVSESPVGRQFVDVLLQAFREVFDEPCIVLKDNVRVDAFDQTLFEDQAV